jgi:hypothetical protein
MRYSEELQLKATRRSQVASNLHGCRITATGTLDCRPNVRDDFLFSRSIDKQYRGGIGTHADAD